MKKLKKLNKIIAVLFVLCIAFQNIAFAEPAPSDESIKIDTLTDDNTGVLELTAETAILGEASTGKIIYQKDMDKKMYPASMTKLLTSLVVLDYFSPEALITTGNEVNDIPWDSSKAGHTKGETLTVKNLIRGLLLPSGNDSANVLAVAVAQKVENNTELTTDECITVFTDLMNKKAKELGATNSHFANAHGYHDENHYTTAYDMFLISQEALKNETISEISKEKEYAGNGAENTLEQSTALKIKKYNWTSHNLLITDNEYQYENAIGLKTGFTDEAGDCLAAAAQKDDITLIAVVFNAEDPARWVDTTALFEYGFNEFGMVDLQKSGDVVDTVALSRHNRLLGDVLDVIVKEDISEYMRKEDAEKVEKAVEYKSDLIIEQKDEQQKTQLKAPISKDAEIGKVTYKLGNDVIKEVNIYAATEVEKRTILNSVQYFFKNLKENLFTVKGIASSVGIIAGVAFIIAMIVAMKSRRNKRRSKYTFQSSKAKRHYRSRKYKNPRIRRR